jgi:hypothetical protein
MALDGTYGFVYCGVIGLGVGVFTVTAGQVTGRDCFGGEYSGTAEERPDGTITLALTFEVQPGIGLVQGTSAQELPYTRQIKVELPPGFGDGAPQVIDVRPGSVTLMFKRIPDDYAPAATEGFSLTMGRREN